ncbi:MAG TPA: hypothetical protein VH041_00720 [Caldimonas sp.]|nr:hypothetical protein [Caldimonas sp.]HEX4232801.1 hypothetical protein [Caldimonas sp.]
MKKALLLSLTLFSAAAVAQSTAPTMRLRGTIEKIDATSIVLKERSGETMTLALADNFAVSEVLPVDPAMIQSGTFVGTAALPGADGSLSALEVLVFPEAMRGTGEGHSQWDLQPGSTMTNATVTSVAPAAKGRTMTLHYKDGTKTIVVPEGIPVVTLKPADRSLLVPGAKVLVTAQMRDGKPTALRATAGRNGFTPPM